MNDAGGAARFVELDVFDRDQRNDAVAQSQPYNLLNTSSTLLNVMSKRDPRRRRGAKGESKPTRHSLLTRPRVRIHTFHKLRRVGIHPIRMRLPQLRTDLLSRRIDRHPLPLERERLRPNSRNQLPLRGNE